LEDIRVGGEQFVEMRDSGKLPYGQLPVLQVDDGVYLAQSSAILRYVGKYAGLYPTEDLVQAAIIDSLLDEEIDLFTGLAVTRYKGEYHYIFPYFRIDHIPIHIDRMGFGSLDNEAVLKIRAKLNDDILPKHLQFLENFLIKSPTGWLAGGIKPSIAEFGLVPRLQWLATPGLHDGISDNILEKFPMVKELIHRFMQLPEIQDYYNKQQ